MAAAAGTVLVLVDTIVIILVCLVVSSMATGTVWLIAGRRPSDDFCI